MKVLSIVRTPSLEYDERVIREAESILKCGASHVDIYAIEKKKSSIDIPNITAHCSKIPDYANKKSILKFAYILFNYIKIELNFNKKSYKCIWIHEPILIFIIPFLRIGYKGKIIWDLHELPTPVFFRYAFFKNIFSLVASCCDSIIVANQERGNYMLENGLIKKFKVLCNYPSKYKDDRLKNYKDKEFEEWTSNKEFAYCQSPTRPARNFLEIAQTCVKEKQYLVVIGKKNHIYRSVKSNVKNFDKYIKVLGKKPSYSLPYYLSRARFSIILYANVNMNNYLCAPNRLYHSIREGIPVIVGSNPTMANIISPNKAGVVVKGYGENDVHIADAIKTLNENYSFYKKNIDLLSDKFIWENLEERIKNILD